MLEGLGRTQQDLLNALLHHAGGMSIDELAEHLAVTRTAIRQHLAALERDGLVLRGDTRRAVAPSSCIGSPTTRGSSSLATISCWPAY
jgi:predicted ArsR family transcriptional regulator